METQDISIKSLSSQTALTTIHTVFSARTEPLFCAGFFHAQKKFLNFFKNWLANHTSQSSVGAERGIEQSFTADREEV